MIVGLATPMFDLNGNMTLPIDPVESKFLNLSQRISRSDTLAGGAVIKTRGYFETNRTIQVVTQLNKEDEDKLLYIFKNYPYLFFGAPDGYYMIVIENISKEENKITLRVLIKEKCCQLPLPNGRGL